MVTYFCLFALLKSLDLVECIDFHRYPSSTIASDNAMSLTVQYCTSAPLVLVLSHSTIQQFIHTARELFPCFQLINTLSLAYSQAAAMIPTESTLMSYFAPPLTLLHQASQSSTFASPPFRLVCSPSGTLSKFSSCARYVSSV